MILRAAQAEPLPEQQETAPRRRVLPTAPGPFRAGEHRRPQRVCEAGLRARPPGSRGAQTAAAAFPLNVSFSSHRLDHLRSLWPRFGSGRPCPGSMAAPTSRAAAPPEWQPRREGPGTATAEASGWRPARGLVSGALGAIGSVPTPFVSSSSSGQEPPGAQGREGGW